MYVHKCKIIDDDHAGVEFAWKIHEHENFQAKPTPKFNVQIPLLWRRQKKLKLFLLSRIQQKTNELNFVSFLISSKRTQKKTKRKKQSKKYF